MQVGELFARLGLDMSDFQAGLNLARSSMQNTSRELVRQAQATSAALQGPERVLQNINTRLQESTRHFQSFAQASNMPQVQQSFSRIEGSIRQTRAELSRLGFGQTKAEVKALEAEMYNLANVRMTRLKEEIALTEKALKQMKESGRADEFAEEIQKAEEALKQYKKELADAEPIKKMAEVAGYEVQKIFGKDVIVKPIKDGVEEAKAKLVGLVNQDLAAMANATYEMIDGAAKRIVGAADTAAQQKAKIAQLATAYQQIGMQATLAAAAMVAVNAIIGSFAAEAEDAWNKFQAQTLTTTSEMGRFKDSITDVSTSTGASFEEVSSVFSYLKNQLGETKETIAESAELAYTFSDAWGVEPVEAIQGIRDVMKKLGVDQNQASDIMTLALQKYQGDIEKATEDVMSHGKEWKNVTAAGTEGAQAFEKMNSALEQGAMGKFGESLRSVKASLIEIYQAVEPTLVKISNGISSAAQSVTEFLRNNPGVASFVGYMGMAATAFTIFVAAGAPVAGLLIQHRALFQGLAQSIVAASTGGVAVLSPQLVAMRTQMTLFKNAILGLPSILASIGPALATMLRAAPGAIAGFVSSFVKMNPMLTAFGVLAFVVAQNWETIGPIFKKLWDDIKLAFEPVMQAFSQANSTILPVMMSILNQISQIIAQVLVGALKTIEPIIRAIAQVINGDFGAAKNTMVELATSFVTVKGGLETLGSFVGIAAAAWGAYTIAVNAAAFASNAYSAVTKVVAAAQTVLNAIMAANPIGVVVVAIGALVAAGVLLYQNWDTMKGKAQEIQTKLNETWEGSKTSISEKWDTIKTKTSEVWDEIKNFFEENGKTILLLATGPAGWAVLLTQELGANWDNIKQTTITAWENIKTGISNVWTSITSGVSSSTENVTSAMKNGLENAWSYIKSIPSQAAQWGKNIIQGLIDGIKSLHIPMPHFNFSVDYKSVAGVSFPVPDVNVNWYKKGGIFTSPTIAGIGDVPEAVLPLAKLPALMTEALLGAAQRLGNSPQQSVTGTLESNTSTVINNNIYFTGSVRNDNDIKRIAQELDNLQYSRSRGLGVK